LSFFRSLAVLFLSSHNDMTVGTAKSSRRA
jgi:hypothetical protein